MGYNMYLMDYSVHIKKEDFADALNAVKAAFPHDKETRKMLCEGYFSDVSEVSLHIRSHYHLNLPRLNYHS